MAGIDPTTPWWRGRRAERDVHRPGETAASRHVRRSSRGARADRRRSGRQVRSEPIPNGVSVFELAVAATLTAAAARRARSAPRAARRPVVRAEDWRQKIRQDRQGSLVVFVVDASESMGTQARMGSAKGAVLALLARAYQQRERVALVVFEGAAARLLVAPTRSVERARQQLRQVPIGGATPLGDGLRLARQVVRAERLKDPSVRPLVVVVSDGEANVPLEPGRSVVTELRRLAAGLRQDEVDCLVIDTKPLGSDNDIMARLAGWLSAPYHRVDELRAQRLVEVIRRHPLSTARSQPRR